MTPEARNSRKTPRRHDGVVDMLGEHLRRRTPPAAEEQVALDRIWSDLREEDVPASVLRELEPAVQPGPGIQRSASRAESGGEGGGFGVSTRPSRIALGAAAGVVLLLSAALVGYVASARPVEARVEAIDGTLYRVSGSDARAIAVGDRVRTNEILRTNGGAGAQLALTDGSRVEMRSQSELALERADDGVRVRLTRGSIIVNAAKQRTGHLYVLTKDVTVSVLGTVFLVNATGDGSRVAVIEGEVQVQEGASRKTLLPGEQVTTSSLTEAWPVRDAIAWSRNARALVTLLQQSAVVPPALAPQNSIALRETFEVTSVRPTAFSAGSGRGGGGGGTTLRPAGEPCGGARAAVEIDPRRFVANDMTLHALIAAAYGLDCRIWSGADRLIGGPGWTKSDGFDIQAGIPDGSPAYTEEQFFANKAPALQKMLQTLLEDRFKLALRQEVREMTVYVLTVAAGGPKLRESSADKGPFIAAWKEGDKPASTHPACCEGTGPEFLHGYKRPMARMVKQLSTILGRPVLDRTGLTGEFNYSVGFAWQQIGNIPVPRPSDGAPREPGAGPPDFRSPSTALEEDLGLKLEGAREKIEVLVIERVERPTEN